MSALVAWPALGTIPNFETLICAPVSVPFLTLAPVTASFLIFAVVTESFLQLLRANRVLAEGESDGIASERQNNGDHREDVGGRDALSHGVSLMRLSQPASQPGRARPVEVTLALGPGRVN